MNRNQSEENKRFNGLSIRLNDSEIEKIKILKEKHYLNISALIRQTINDLYNKLESKDIK